jgi:hypothetical protein
MNSRFIPRYPPALQQVVHHADRLCELIALRELIPPRDEWAAAWLYGRAEEMARFAQDILDSWREGRVEEVKASAMLEAYLASLQAGMAKHRVA